MGMPTEEQMKAIHENTKALEQLSDTNLIMVALAELIMSGDNIPVGKRVPLHAALNNRAGVRY